MDQNNNNNQSEKEIDVSPFIRDLVILNNILMKKNDTLGIIELDQKFRRVLSLPQENKNTRNWLVYNEFRVLHASILPSDRPKVLIGGLSNDPYPTMHIPPLFRVADVVSLTTTDTKNRKDRVLYKPISDDIHSILKKMPNGFSPAFFFDNQVESGHLIPRKLIEAPFITIAAVCHIFKTASIENVCRLFDVILPLSQSFTPMIKAMTKNFVIDMPFGLNWGAFPHLIHQDISHAERDIDVSLTFGDSVNDVYGDLRYQVTQLFKNFSEKYKEKYRCVIATGLSKEDYLDILKRSKISLNVVGIHGPYNYRTVEVMLCGALLFQLENTYYPIHSYLQNYLKDGVHYSAFTYQNFENKLLYFLTRSESVDKIAKKGRDFLIDEFSYEKLYETLFKKVRKLQLKKVSEKDILNDTYLGMLYCYSNIPQYRLLVKLALSDLPRVKYYIQINNLLVVLCLVYLENKDEKEILGMLGGSPKMTQWFQNGFSQGIKNLRELGKDDILIQWHYLMFSTNFSLDNIDEFIQFSNIIEKNDYYHFYRDQQLFYHLFRPPYMNDIEFNNISIGFFEIRLAQLYLNNSVDKDISSLCLEFMRWHCYRYLFEKSDNKEFYAKKLLSLFYENSQLHLKLSEYYRVKDIKKSEFHYNEAVKFLPTLQKKL